MPRKPTLVVLSLVAFAPTLLAQCALTWSASPQPQLSGSPTCSTLWDPDGAGPLPQRLVVGGHQLLAGAQLLGNQQPSTQGVMSWDGSAWLPIGSGLGNPGGVRGLAEWNGDLYACGDFSLPGGATYVARWDGSAWQAVGLAGPGTPSTSDSGISHLITWNGMLVAAGHVLSPAAVAFWTWNGTAWTQLPPPPVALTVSAMVAFAGEMIFAGWATPFGAQFALERWNGSSWGTTVLAVGSIECLATRTSQAVGGATTLFVGGAFTSIGTTGLDYVARTNGGATFAFSPVGSPTHAVRSMVVHNSGLADFTVAASTTDPAAPMKRYSSATNAWSALGAPANPLFDLIRYAGNYHGLTSATSDGRCQRYDGAAWVPVSGPGITGEIRAATRSGNDTVVGGDFPTISGVVMNRIARWNGSTFTPLGAGLTGASVDALLTLDNGDIVAGGSFSAAGGVPASNVARWNGTAWSAMGTGLDGSVYALAQMPNGDVIAGGAFTFAGGVFVSKVAKWNGLAWGPMAPLDLGIFGDVRALAVNGNGVVFAGGAFTVASGVACNHIVRWNGVQWQSIGGGVNGDVHGIAFRPDGDLVAVGAFTQAGSLAADRCARWNGSAWFSMGAASGAAGPARAVLALPNGDVVAGRGFHEPTAVHDSGISRWNGSAWSSLGVLAANGLDPVDVRVLVQRADGDLVVGGNIRIADLRMARSLTSLRSDCMPAVVPYGAGCASAAGPLTIAADTLPFLGAEFGTTTTNLAPLTLGIGVIGFSQTNLPLSLLLSEGQSGCTLLAAPDLTLLLANGPGTAHSSLQLANSAALLGARFHQQTILLEFDAGGTLVAVRGSDALTATIGGL